MSSFAIATSARTAPGATVSQTDVEREFRRALKPIGSGVFLPLFSLPSYFDEKPAGQREYGMGDTGPAARDFVLRLEAAGQKFWSLLPLGPTDERNCPYRTESAFAIGLNTVSPDDLLRDGWVTQDEVDCVLPCVADPGRIPLRQPEILSFRRRLLSSAFLRYKRQTVRHDEFAAFLSRETNWLHDYAVFRVIREIHPERWTEWPDELRDAQPAALQTFAAQHADAVEREKFFQFIAQHYFVQLRDFAAAHGIRLIGDMPAYSMHGSADVWANRPVFALDDRGRRTVVAGAPPDMFDPVGQAWNHPMYRWDEPATVAFLKEKYARWHRLLGDGLLRDDHIIGKITPWAYRFGTPPANGWREEGKFLGRALFDALSDEIPDLPQFLIAEDLGTVTDETKQLIRHYGFMGMRILQFVPFRDGLQAVDGNMYTPGNYPDQNVLMLGTHDTPLVRHWWRHALKDEGRRHLAAYLQRELGSQLEITDANVAAVLTDFAMRQSPHMVIHAMADLIVNNDGTVGLVDTPMNDPSAGADPVRWHNNWSWRLAPDAFGQDTAAILRQLTDSSDRSPEKAIRQWPPIMFFDAETRLATALLRGCGPTGEALSKQFESLVRDGFVRRGPFGAEILSAVYRPVEGTAYLVLSDHGVVPDFASPAQKAVSLVRAFAAFVGGEPEREESPLEEVADDVLLRRAEEEEARIERALQWTVALSSDDQREEMVVFAGSLLDSDEPADPRLSARHRLMHISPAARAELRQRFQQIWTDLWVTYEARDVARENIVEGILNGSLHGARRSLRGLRWCVAHAFARTGPNRMSARDSLIALVSGWADTLSLNSVETVLFGYGQPAFMHELDLIGHAEGVAGLLGLIRKARRRGQNITPYRKRFCDCATQLVRAAGGQSPQRDGLLGLLERFRGDTGLRELEGALALFEEKLFDRLVEVKRPAGDQSDPGFPAQIDMQIHSYHSDCGGQSVARIVYEAYRRGLTTIAITDHQTMDGVPQAVAMGRLLGIEVIPAVELYSGIRRDDGRVHERRDILVYFPDVDAFLAWFADGLDDETWTLFNDGWNRKADGKQWGDVPIRRVTDWARARGGVPVCAHPGLYHTEDFHREGWSYEAFERLFFETGLAGIEISHSRLPFEENTTRFVPLVQEFNRRHPDKPIVFTIGTDAHCTDNLARANLTEQTVAFVARELAPGDNPPASLREAIVRQLQEVGRRIGEQTPLYRLRNEVLRGNFPGRTPFNRSLNVLHPDAMTPSTTITAGIKLLDDQPIIIAVNQGRREHYEGKDWGRLDLAAAFGMSENEQAHLIFRDLLTDETYDHTAQDLCENGLHVGLPPFATQFLALTRGQPRG